MLVTVSLCVLLAAWAGAAAAGRAVWAAPNGSGAACSAAAPCALAAAAAAARHGDILRLCAGTFRLGAPLALPAGVAVRGAGAHATELRCAAPSDDPARQPLLHMLAARGGAVALAALRLHGGDNANCTALEAIDVASVALDSVEVVAFHNYVPSEGRGAWRPAPIAPYVIAVSSAVNATTANATALVVELRNVTFRDVSMRYHNTTQFEPIKTGLVSVEASYVPVHFTMTDSTVSDVDMPASASALLILVPRNATDSRVSISRTTFRNLTAVNAPAFAIFGSPQVPNTAPAAHRDQKTGLTYMNGSLAVEIRDVEVSDCKAIAITEDASAGIGSVLVEGMNLAVIIDKATLVDNVCDHIAWGGNFALAACEASGILIRADVGTLPYGVTMPLGHLNVSVTDSEFSRNTGLGQHGALSVSVHAWAFNGVVVIENNRFEGNMGARNKPGELRPPSSGGAFALEQIPYLPVPGWTWFANLNLSVVDSVFVGNGAGLGGGLHVEHSCSLADMFVDVSGSTFSNNKAFAPFVGSGGAIRISESAINYAGSLGPVTFGTGLIHANLSDVSFQENVAVSHGGGFAFETSNVFVIEFLESVLGIARCRFDANEGGRGAQLFAEIGSVGQVLDCTIDGTQAGDAIFIAGRGPNKDGFALVTDCEMTCDAGMFAEVAVSVEKSVGSVDARCISCAEKTYNLAGQKVAINSTRSSKNTANFCLPCPPGSSPACDGDTVGASKDFWAFVPDNATAHFEVDMLQCPHGYCCSKLGGCERANTCHGNRTSVLCGGCRRGFTHALTPNERCVEALTCTTTNVVLTWATHVLVAACIVFFFFVRRRGDVGIASGAVKVLVAWANACLLLTLESIRLHELLAEQSGVTESSNSVLATVFGTLSGTVRTLVSNDFVVCPWFELSSFSKLIFAFSIPAIMVVLWCVGSVVTVWLAQFSSSPPRQIPVDNDDDDRSDEHDLEKPLLQSVSGGDDGLVGSKKLVVVEGVRSTTRYRVFAAMFNVIDFSVFTIISACLSILVQTDVPNVGRRVLHAGDYALSSTQEVGFGILLGLTVLNPIVIHLGWRFVRSLFTPRSALVLSVSDAEFSSVEWRWRHWTMLITLRRILLALIVSFLGSNDPARTSLVRTVLLASLVSHLLVKPFRSAFVNNLETVSLASTLLASCLQRPVTVQSGPSGADTESALLVAQVWVLGLTGVGMAVSLLWVKRRSLVCACGRAPVNR